MSRVCYTVSQRLLVVKGSLLWRSQYLKGTPGHIYLGLLSNVPCLLHSEPEVTSGEGEPVVEEPVLER